MVVRRKNINGSTKNSLFGENLESWTACFSVKNRERDKEKNLFKPTKNVSILFQRFNHCLSSMLDKKFWCRKNAETNQISHIFVQDINGWSTTKIRENGNNQQPGYKSWELFREINSSFYCQFHLLYSFETWATFSNPLFSRLFWVQLGGNCCVSARLDVSFRAFSFR